MRRILTADGRCITPAQFVAEALHPSNHGQVTSGIGLDTFTAPASPEPSPGAGRAAIPAPPHAGAGPAGGPLLASGRSPLAHNN